MSIEITTACRWLRAAFIGFALLAGTPAWSASLQEVVRSGNLESLQHMVVQGADVNEKGIRNETPLILASLAGHGEIVNYLLQRGADIHEKNDGGLSALHAAAYGGHEKIVSLLVAKGADINDSDNRYGVAPLHLASEENNLSTVRTLIALGADVTAMEVNGYSVLSRAGFREHWEIVNLLLEDGAKCQPAEKVGDWLFDECTKRAAQYN